MGKLLELIKIIGFECIEYSGNYNIEEEYNVYQLIRDENCHTLIIYKNGIVKYDNAYQVRDSIYISDCNDYGLYDFSSLNEISLNKFIKYLNEYSYFKPIIRKHKISLLNEE